MKCDACELIESGGMFADAECIKHGKRKPNGVMLGCFNVLLIEVIILALWGAVYMMYGG